MKTLLFILSMNLFFLGCYSDSPESIPDPDYVYNDLRIAIRDDPTIIIMGDSRADFGGTWDALPYTVINAGAAGSTSIGIILRLGYIAYYHPSHVFIFTGVNDARKITSDQLDDNLNIIIDFCDSLDVKILILDITVIPDFSSDEFEENRIVMSAHDNYLPINYSSADFVDEVHLSSDGYVTVSNSIINFMEKK